MRNTIRHVTRGCLVAFGVLILAITGFAAWNWRSTSIYLSNVQGILGAPGYFGGMGTAEDMLAYIQQHPTSTALAIATVQQDGSVGFDTMHNQAMPMPLASTMKIVVLAAYAREVEQGRLDPDEQILLTDWERYYLPDSDGGAHKAALAELNLLADGSGFSTDGAASVKLDQLARAMIRFSDNAATDYLLARLGQDAVQSTIEEAGLTQQEPIQPIVGTFLSWHNHEQPDQSVARRDELLTLGTSDYAAEAARLEAAYLDPAWREAELRWQDERSEPVDVAYQSRLAQALMPHGTAEDYARIMAGVVSDSFLSAEVSAIMRRHLEWPMEKPGNQQNYQAFGAKGGSVLGVQNEAMYMIPKSGDYADQRRVMVLLINEMPFSAWFRLSQTFANQDFLVKIATEQAFANRVEAELAAVR
ncbi:MAG: serine hydrolase [Roseiflexaceae bacterium]|nr:serine hydrolase [Roseiflexaceae bacterium]